MEKHAADLAAMGAISDVGLVTGKDKANRENADLDRRYGTSDTEYGDMMPALPPISMASQNVALPDAGTAAGGWRASVAMYRAERDAKARSGGSDKRDGKIVPSSREPVPPAVPPVGGGSSTKIARPAVLQGTAECLTEAERRRKIEENLTASVDPTQLQYVTADGTLC